jgi:hypothetical protein
MNRRKLLLTSGGAIFTGISTSSLHNPVIGINFEISGPQNKDPSKVNSIIVEFDKLELTPKYIDDDKDVTVSSSLELDGHKTKEEINTQVKNGETKDISEALGSMFLDGVSLNSDYNKGKVTVNVEHPDISQESYEQSFDIPDERVIFLDDYQGSKGTKLGSDYLISQGIRRPRNTDTETFNFQENGGSSMNMKHDGSGSDNTFGEIALDINLLSNNEWEINMYGQSWSYNSQQNNYRIGLIDKTNRDNFCEFMETESSGVSPRVAGNNVNSSYTSNDVSFAGGTKYDWSFNMNNGKITVYKDAKKVFSKSGFPAGEYVWFVMNENDSDTSAEETHLLDKLEIMK